MESTRNKCIAASKAIGEGKKVPMNKVWVDFALPTKIKAV
jgi:hypothetical protein